MSNGKNEGGQAKKQDRKQARRAFLKAVGAVGATAVLGATTVLQQTQAQQPQPQPLPGACLQPKGGFLAPTPAVARELIAQLQTDLGKDPTLRARYLDNPRSVMGARGFGSDLMNEVLTAHGVPSLFRDDCRFTCIITSCGQTIVLRRD